ncbi:E3 SUMO-protein ligase PIAS2-like [Hyalella azteca]|uniref:E3 SUMO-protein ligase PIAS2-like n=1 Tax=Hyalella azteca TaxID=294128 RepID=A0A979FR20_HYAAZ|nr:E3 SUMO-protein ligase PIAS2-like [Hyalella azteca]
MPRTRRSTEELRQHVAAAQQLQQQQQGARRTTPRQAALDSASSISTSQSIIAQSLSSAAGAVAPVGPFGHTSLQPAGPLGIEVMSYGARGSQGAGGAANPHGLHVNKVPSVPLSTMAYAQQTGVSSQQQRSYSAAISAAGLAMTYPASAAALSAQQLSSANYPINPDVKLKKLPFYDILAELLKPSSLAPQGSGRYQELGFNFSLTPHQANKIANSRDLRPGKLDYNVQSPIPTSKPGVEPKRPSRPVNITALCRISPTVTNRVQVSWASEYGRCYVISVYLVQKLSSDDLLHRLKSKGVRIADFTRSLIKQKLNEDGDCEIATTSLRCSLMCPLGKMRMLLPCRANTCNHLQCFDASLYLQMNERKPTWTCPVCDKPAVYDTLVIDGYFQDVLRLNTTSNEVTLHKDGSWTPLVAKKERPEPQAEKRKSIVAIETLSDSDDDAAPTQPSAAPTNNVLIDDSVVEEVPSGGEAAAKKKASSNVEIITLETSSEEDDDDDDEEEDDDAQPPPAKRPYDPALASSGVPPSEQSNKNDSTATTPTPEGLSSNNEVPVGVTESSPMTPSHQVPLPPPVISASVASSLAQLPAGTSVLATNADGSLPTVGSPASNAAAVAAAAASSTAAAVATITPVSHSPVGSDGAKSDDSWSVGTVDPGKRLIFRKSMTCSSNGSSVATVNGGSGPSDGDASALLAAPASSPSVVSCSPPHNAATREVRASDEASSSQSDVPNSRLSPVPPSSPSSQPSFMPIPRAFPTQSSQSTSSQSSSEISQTTEGLNTGGNDSVQLTRRTRTSNRATRFQGITWEGDSDSSSDEEFDGDVARDDSGGRRRQKRGRSISAGRSRTTSSSSSTSATGVSDATPAASASPSR